MAPSLHISDEATVRAAQAALTFVVSIWLGVEKGFFIAHAPSLQKARVLAKMIEQRVSNNRLAMVYAPQDDGRMVFIPAYLDQQINGDQT